MTAAEFSRPIRLDTIGDAARSVTIEASEAERDALARRFGLVAIEALAATATLTRTGMTVSAEGRLTAAVVQACVATGAPLNAEIAEPFALRFVPPPAASADEEIELDEAALDTVLYEGGAVDLGEAVAQTLALALDPFPRAPDADAALRAAGVIGEEQAGPFAKLLDLKGRLQT